MTFRAVRDYCNSKAYCEEDFPFDEETICFKVGGKIFAISNIGSDSHTVNLKCDPERALELREKYHSVTPGYHMNKKHWNTVDFSNGELTAAIFFSLVDHSYDLVFQSLPRKIREDIKNG